MKKKRMEIVLSAGLALAFSLVFYAFNTPLGASIGSDNAMYLTLGTALANGYAPYTQIFDHKGPLLYLLQAVPQILSGGYSTLAVFIQEAVVLFACLMVLRAMAREMGVSAWGVQLFYLALICSLTGGGNLTEEYTSLPTLLALYTALRVFGGEKPKEKLFAPAMLMGACATAAFMMRANNAMPVGALVFVLALGLAFTRRFALLGQCAAGFTLGMLIVGAPILLWLWAEGSLSAAWYGAIVHNMMYTETGDGSRVAMLLTSGYGHAALLMAAVSCAGAWVMMKKRHAPLLGAAMVAAAAAGGAAAFLSHKFYDHYLILGAPLAALGMASILSTLSKPRIRQAGLCVLTVCCGLWLGVQGVKTNEWRLSERQDLKQFTQDAQTLMAQVPQDERGHFMAYRVEPRWYVAAEVLPCMRFYFLQEILAQADPAVMDEIVATFESDPPHWLVIYYNREFYPPYDARVAEIFETKYEFVDAAGQYQLLRLKE